MQPGENMKSYKVTRQAVWLENIDQRRSKTRMLTFLHDIAKPPSATCLTDKDHSQATSCKPIYHSKPVICNFCSHSAKAAWRLQKK